MGTSPSCWETPTHKWTTPTWRCNRGGNLAGKCRAGRSRTCAGAVAGQPGPGRRRRGRPRRRGCNPRRHHHQRFGGSAQPSRTSKSVMPGSRQHPTPRSKHRCSTKSNSFKPSSPTSRRLCPSTSLFYAQTGQRAAIDVIKGACKNVGNDGEDALMSLVQVSQK